jgi:hypothetical protein
LGVFDTFENKKLDAKYDWYRISKYDWCIISKDDLEWFINDIMEQIEL